MVDVNSSQARLNMVEQQIRPWNILDQRVLDIMAEIPREQFVPSEYRNLAFTDTEIPIANGQVMLAPKMQAAILQALNIQANDKILEIGTGNGFLTACLARLGQNVTSVEINGELLETAQGNLSQQGISNVSLESGDASAGWDGSFDVIAITGSYPDYQDQYKQSLNMGGRLFVISGQGHTMEARLIIRTADDAWTDEVLFETEIAALENCEVKKSFEF